MKGVGIGDKTGKTAQVELQIALIDGEVGARSYWLIAHSVWHYYIQYTTLRALGGTASAGSRRVMLSLV